MIKATDMFLRNDDMLVPFQVNAFYKHVRVLIDER